MCVDCRRCLGLGFRRALADEFRLFNGGHRLPHKILFIVNDSDIFFCEISNPVVCNFPEFLCDLRDKAEIVRNDYHAAFEVFNSPSEGIN